jgi:hypothetical protein
MSAWLLTRSALLRGPRCARSCSGPQPTLLPGVFWANLGARTTHRSFQSRTETCLPVLPIRAPPRLVHFVRYGSRVHCLLCSLLPLASLSATFIFMQAYVGCFRPLVSRARSTFTCARARALSSPPPMRPIRPCSAHCISYARPWFPASMRRSCLSLRNPGTKSTTPTFHLFCSLTCLCLQRASRCAARSARATVSVDRCAAAPIPQS